MCQCGQRFGRACSPQGGGPAACRPCLRCREERRDNDLYSQDLKGNYSAQMIESNLNAFKEMFNNTDGVADFEKTEDGVRYFVTFSDITDYMTLYPDLKKKDV